MGSLLFPTDKSGFTVSGIFVSAILWFLESETGARLVKKLLLFQSGNGTMEQIAEYPLEFLYRGGIRSRQRHFRAIKTPFAIPAFDKRLHCVLRKGRDRSFDNLACQRNPPSDRRSGIQRGRESCPTMRTIRGRYGQSALALRAVHWASPSVSCRYSRGILTDRQYVLRRKAAFGCQEFYAA